MLRWTGIARTRVAPAVALAYLADPRHAPEWFARVTVEEPPRGAPRVGQTWRFRDVARRSAQPLRMAEYAPPRRFVWETALPPARTNLVWGVECEPAAEGGSTLRLTLAWRPGLLGWPAALAALALARGGLAKRAQRTAERACAAVEAAYPAPPNTAGGAGTTRRARRGRKSAPRQG